MTSDLANQVDPYGNDAGDEHRMTWCETCTTTHYPDEHTEQTMIHPSVKAGDRVRVTIETTVLRIADNPESKNGTPAWTNLAFGEHTAAISMGDPGPSYFTLELPTNIGDTEIDIERIS